MATVFYALEHIFAERTKAVSGRVEKYAKSTHDIAREVKDNLGIAGEI